MTNTEATTLLKRIADRRLMIHVNGTVMEAEHDEVQEALDLAIAALERERWHDAGEQIPDGENIIGWYGGGEYDQLRWFELVDGTVYEGERLIAWYRLPDPPKEDKP